jgi:hypothetical protein
MHDLRRDVVCVWHQVHALNYIFAGAFAKLRKATINFICLYTVCLFARTEQFGSYWADYMKFFIWVFFENLLRKLKFY